MTNWHKATGKIVDFFFFLSSVDTITDQTNERYLYEKTILPALKKSDSQKKPVVLNQWIRSKRESETGITPGTIIDTAISFATFILCSIAFLTGFGATYTFLQYSGRLPVNITVYFFLFAIIPFFLLIMSLVALFTFRRGKPAAFFRLPYLLMKTAIIKTANRFIHKLSAEKRLQLEAIENWLKKDREGAEKILFRSLYKLSQAAGLLFSTGVLLATLFRVTTADVAFGWQTTIRTGPEAIASLVEIVSFPWASFIPAHIAAPTPEQIEGSRIILKDGIDTLAASDLAAWWPFMCLTILFYTILPRLILFGIAAYKERSEARRIITGSIAGDRLFRMMTKARLKSSGIPDTKKPAPTKISHQEVETAPRNLVPEKALLFIHEDIFHTPLKSFLLEQVEARFTEITKTHAITGDPEEDKAVFSGTGKNAGVPVIVLEAWQPPIKEVLDYLLAAESVLGTNGHIILILTGKPFPDGSGFSPVTDIDFRVWQTKLKSAGASNIYLMRLPAEKERS